MNNNGKDRLQIIIGILVGVFGSFLWGQIDNHKINMNLSWEVFYIMYTTTAALCISLIGTTSAWKWILSMMVANYLAGYAFVHFWGQFGPFDLIFMAFYSVPCMLVAYAVSYMRKVYGD